MIERREFLLEVEALKCEADAFMDVAGAKVSGPLELLRLSALLVEGRASLVVNMLELMMYEKEGDTEPVDGPRDN